MLGVSLASKFPLKIEEKNKNSFQKLMLFFNIVALNHTYFQTRHYGIQIVYFF